jgi:hypothetical protein
MNSEAKIILRLPLLLRLFFLLFPVLLLIVSAALKTHVLLAVPSPEFLISGSFPLTLSVVWLEFLLAAWLASRWQPKLATLTAVAVFTIFAMVSLFKLSRGATNCGCFGAFQTSPWLSLTLDLAAIVCLVFNYSLPQHSGRQWVTSVFGLAAIVCLLQVALVTRFSPFLSSGEIIFDGYSGITFLEPSKWVEKEFPLIPWLENGDQLKQGRWTVFLLISQCDLCHEVLKTLPKNNGEVRVAVIEFPPYLVPRADEKADAFYFQIDAEKKWFVAAPVKLETRDGIVTAVTTRDEIKSDIAN